MQPFDPYARLGVSRDADAGQIRAAYLRANEGTTRRTDPARFDACEAAYELLGDPIRRAQVDGLVATTTAETQTEPSDVAARFIALGNEMSSARKFRAASVCFDQACALDPSPDLSDHCDQLRATAAAQSEALTALHAPGGAAWIKGLIAVRYAPSADHSTVLARCELAVRVHRKVPDQAQIDWIGFEGEFPAAADDLAATHEQVVAVAQGQGTVEDIAQCVIRVGPHPVSRKRRTRVSRRKNRLGRTSRISRRLELAITCVVGLLAVGGIAYLASTWINPDGSHEKLDAVHTIDESGRTGPPGDAPAFPDEGR